MLLIFTRSCVTMSIVLCNIDLDGKPKTNSVAMLRVLFYGDH